MKIISIDNNQGSMKKIIDKVKAETLLCEDNKYHIIIKGVTLDKLAISELAFACKSDSPIISLEIIDCDISLIDVDFSLTLLSINLSIVDLIYYSKPVYHRTVITTSTTTLQSHNLFTPVPPYSHTKNVAVILDPTYNHDIGEATLYKALSFLDPSSPTENLVSVKNSNVGFYNHMFEVATIKFGTFTAVEQSLIDTPVFLPDTYFSLNYEDFRKIMSNICLSPSVSKF